MILYGGSSARLLSVSRTLMSKQFVKLFQAQPLFQLTVERNQPIYNKQYMVSNV